jgi:hypothetical protein
VFLISSFAFYSNILNVKDAVPQSNTSILSPVPEDEYIGDDIEDTWPLAPGPLPKEARQEAMNLASFVVEGSERIARKFKKSRREIMLAAGLSTREARAPNPFNLYRKWYAHHIARKDKSSE